MAMNVHKTPPAPAESTEHAPSSNAPTQDGRDLARESRNFDAMIQQRKDQKPRQFHKQQDESPEEGGRQPDGKQQDQSVTDTKKPPRMPAHANPPGERETRRHDGQPGSEPARHEQHLQSDSPSGEADMRAMLRGRMPLKRGKDHQIQEQGTAAEAKTHSEDAALSSRHREGDTRQDAGLCRDAAQHVINTMQSPLLTSSTENYRLAPYHNHNTPSSLSQSAHDLADKVNIQVSDPEFSSQKTVRISFNQLPELQRLGIADGQISISMQNDQCIVTMNLPQETHLTRTLALHLEKHLKRTVPDAVLKVNYKKQQTGNEPLYKWGRSHGQRDPDEEWGDE